MSRIINNFFINRKLKELHKADSPINIQNSLFKEGNLVVLFNEKSSSIGEVLAVEAALQKAYPASKIIFLFVNYLPLYEEIVKSECFKYIIPRPISFKELDESRKTAKRIGKVDVFLDLSTLDWSSKLMLKRILSPGISVSFYDEKIAGDYNLLIKSSTGSPVHLLRMLGIPVAESAFGDFLNERLKEIHAENFETVFVGSSSAIRRGIKRSIAKGAKFIVADDLREKLDLFILKSIFNAREIVADKQFRTDIENIKKLNKTREK